MRGAGLERLLFERLCAAHDFHKLLRDTSLARAIETNEPYALAPLFDLHHEEFQLALGMIKDWRVDRHYLSKLRMLELGEMEAQGIAEMP